MHFEYKYLATRWSSTEKIDSEIILTMLKYCLLDVGFYWVFTTTCNIFTNKLQYKDSITKIVEAFTRVLDVHLHET